MVPPLPSGQPATAKLVRWRNRRLGPRALSALVKRMAISSPARNAPSIAPSAPSRPSNSAGSRTPWPETQPESHPDRHHPVESGVRRVAQTEGNAGSRTPRIRTKAPPVLRVPPHALTPHPPPGTPAHQIRANDDYGQAAARASSNGERPASSDTVRHVVPADETLVMCEDGPRMPAGMMSVR